MKDTAPDTMVPGACNIPIIDTWVTWSGTAGGANEYITVGEPVPIGNSSIINAGPIGPTQVATAAQRRMAQTGICMETTRTGKRCRVRIQGPCLALVKCTANVAVSANDELNIGTATNSVKYLEATRPNVNTNRAVARAVGTIASGSSAAGALIEVVMLGVYGHGLNGQGA